MSLPTNVDFVLTAFEQSFTLSTSALIPSETLTLDVSATITLSNGISVADLQKVFFYRTDEDITSLPFDSSFVYYYTDVGMWPTTVSATPIRDTLNPTNGIVTGNYYVSGDNMSKDFIRELEDSFSELILVLICSRMKIMLLLISRPNAQLSRLPLKTRLKVLIVFLEVLCAPLMLLEVFS